MAHSRTLKQIIILNGGSVIPGYERIALTVARRDLSALFNSLSGAIPKRTGSKLLFEAIRNFSLPSDWETIEGPKARVPQWTLYYSGPEVKALGADKIKVHICTCTSSDSDGDSTHRGLYIRDLPFLQGDEQRFASKYSDDAAWLTLYAYGDWKHSWKKSHEVAASISLEGHVSYYDLQ